MPKAYLYAAALVFFATAGLKAMQGARDDVIYVLESPEIQAAEKRLPIAGGDFGWHFVSARWGGESVRLDEASRIYFGRVNITLTYSSNYAIGAKCEINASLDKTWPSDRPAEVKKTVSLACDCKSSLRKTVADQTPVCP